MNKTLRTLLVSALVLCGVICAAAPRMVYVARHGQVGDKNRRDAKINEHKLTVLGEEQARKLAGFLTDGCSFKGAVVVSPFYRTIQTALPVADALGTVPILDPGFQEIAPQEKPTPRGMTLAEIEERFPRRTRPGSAYADNWRLCREDDRARERRVAAALDRVLAEIPHGDVLIVSHAGTVNTLVRVLNARRADGVKAVKNLPWNCSLFIFELDGTGKVVKSRFTTEYLPDDRCTDNLRRTKTGKTPARKTRKAKP